MRRSFLFLPLALAAAAAPAPAADADAVTIEVAADHIDFKVGKALATRYHIGAKVAKPYFWPMNAPGDIPVTRAWPMEEAGPKGTKDHVHQKSAWFCHGDLIPEGIELKTRSADKHVQGVDFWSEGKGHGQIVCTKVEAPRIADGHGSVVTRNEWRSPDGVPVLAEQRTIHLRNPGPSRLLVLDIDLDAKFCPVTFGDTKEGAMGVRVSDQIAVKTGKGTLSNAEGKTTARSENDVWGQRSAWCDYSGKVDGKEAGVAIFDDPANPYPACWHSRNYGLMAANPFGRDKSGFPAQKGKTDLVKLAKGEHLKLRYGILLHAGDVKAGKVAEAFEQFRKGAK